MEELFVLMLLGWLLIGFGVIGVLYGDRPVSKPFFVILLLALAWPKVIYDFLKAH